jgi:hypothetical protein
MKELKSHIIDKIRTDAELQFKIASKLGKQNPTIYKWALNKNHKLLTTPIVLEIISAHTNKTIDSLTTEIK